MEHSPSCKANSSTASQQIPRIVRNPNVHYGTQKRPPPVPSLTWTRCRISNPFSTYQTISPSARTWEMFRNIFKFIRWRVVSAWPNPKLEDHPFDWHSKALLTLHVRWRPAHGYSKYCTHLQLFVTYRALTLIASVHTSIAAEWRVGDRLWPGRWPSL